VDQAAAFPGEVARAALKEGAAAVILAHNHPSGCPEASVQDRALTRDVEAALRTVGVGFLDHVVVAREGHQSISGENRE
jgi:DNA repair protein RadC